MLTFDSEYLAPWSSAHVPCRPLLCGVHPAIATTPLVTCLVPGACPNGLAYRTLSCACFENDCIAVYVLSIGTVS